MLQGAAVLQRYAVLLLQDVAAVCSRLLLLRAALRPCVAQLQLSLAARYKYMLLFWATDCALCSCVHAVGAAELSCIVRPVALTGGSHLHCAAANCRSALER